MRFLTNKFGEGITSNTDENVNISDTDKRYVNFDGDSMSGILDMQNNRIINVANPVSSTDAATKGVCDNITKNLTKTIANISRQIYSKLNNLKVTIKQELSTQFVHIPEKQTVTIKGGESQYISVKNPNWNFVLVNVRVFTSYLTCILSRDSAYWPYTFSVRGDGEPKHKEFRYDYFIVLEVGEISNKGFKLNFKNVGYHLFSAHGYTDRKGDYNYRITSINIY